MDKFDHEDVLRVYVPPGHSCVKAPLYDREHAIVYKCCKISSALNDLVVRELTVI